MPLAGGQRYHTSTSVFLNEVIKLTISLTMALYEMSKTLPSNTTIATLSHTLTTAIFTNESWKLAIPAVIYTIQNNLQYLAVSNLDAATFQVTYQLKILTTAIFSVLLLGRSLSARKWLSLLLLVVGVSIIQVPQAISQPEVPGSQSTPWTKTLEQLHGLGNNVAARMAKRSGSYEGIHADRAAQVPHMNKRVGLLAVLISCALSGLAGVLFEKILKDSTSAKTTTLWVRNCQLSFWSLFPSLFLGVIWKDGEIIAKTGFFAGYNWVVWTAIGFQAAGGVIVALVINYADNIAKNFATSISILLSCIASVYFFDFKVTRSFFLGTSIVLFATYLYTKPERGMQQSTVKIANFEKTTVERSYDDRGYDAVPSNPSSSRYESRYDILQPQFKQPARPVAHRDRYRTIRYDDPMYDTVEDAGADDLDSQLDSFDNRLPQELHPARQHQVPQSKGRLSFAPGPSAFCSNDILAHTQPSNVTRGSHSNGHQGDHRSHLEQDMNSQFNCFAHHPGQHQELTSDPPMDSSSSPAYKANQRRMEQAALGASQCGSRAKLSRNGLQYDTELQHYGHRQPCRQAVSLESQERNYHQVPTMTQKMDKASLCNGQQTPRELRTDDMSELNAPPMCQGIRLVPVATLPDCLRTVFPYPTFNAVQSKCFDKIFRSDDNFVLAAPTGSGKTVILELAICRVLVTNATGQYKIVYQAPTKALCSERQRDWKAKFEKIGLKCAELTGDSDASDLRQVQSANIIITTPEKWDSMTRKWKDHEKLMRLIKVFLIDEVHILKEDRGATLEAVVSRMKSIGTNVRFVALSATVPNFKDIARWLGRSSFKSDIPALNESFGEEFRPVKLRKYVCGYAFHDNNDFKFEKFLDTRIPDVIASYSERKPIMVFCATRKSTASTAKLIASWWASNTGSDRFWVAPSKSIPVLNKELRETVASGVAFHHAGLDADDRIQIESNFIAGEISVICCTSTLAIGVNLPCHLVIIKNTVVWSTAGLQEYSDLEMMQMLGRAGRPQFDNTAVAVIMTRQAKVRHYESMVTGREIIESKLHLNLVDHMNAEIGLGTIRDLPSTRKWLKGTFLFVRLQQNPEYYKLEGDTAGQSIEEQVDDICFRDINLLRESNLVSGQEFFKCTEFGHAMSRYYVCFETMKLFMELQPKSPPSEILSVIVQAKEYSNIRFRQGEKSLYKALNKSPSIRWPFPVNLDLPAQKISLIIQSVLGSADISWEGELAKHKTQYTTDTMIVFKNLGSLIRCIIDCQIVLGDAVTIHSALMLERSFGARAWDDSPLQMKQIETLGVVSVRKLVNAGIKSIEDLEACEPQRIEALIGRNPPYGLKILKNIKDFPKLRVSLQAQTSTIMKIPEGVKIQIKADVGFMNERPPHEFNKKIIYVCLLLETSDGRKSHFARISGSKLGTGQTITVPVLLTSPDQSINCHVMCDGIAGSMRSATVRPQIPSWMHPSSRNTTLDTSAPNQSNMSKRRIENIKATRKPTTSSDDFGDGDLDDDALVEAADVELEFNPIESYDDPLATITASNTAKTIPNKGKGTVNSRSLTKQPEAVVENTTQGPVQLPNGKWRQPNAPPPKNKEIQTRIQLTATKRKSLAEIEELDLTQQDKRQKVDQVEKDPKDRYKQQSATKGKDQICGFGSSAHSKSSHCYPQQRSARSSSVGLFVAERPLDSSDYGSIPFHEGLDSPQQCSSSLGLYNSQPHDEDFMDCEPITAGASPRSDTFGDDDSLLGDAMIGLADSYNLQANNESETNTMQGIKKGLGCGNKESLNEAREWMNKNATNFTYGVLAHALEDETEENVTLKTGAILSHSSQGERKSTVENSALSSAGVFDESIQRATSEQKSVPDAFKDLEPWLFQEFGNIIELVDE
ncbi:ATP-dependent DNA helicase MER3 [Curvularia clavata]|uniref:DNA 3'-5' helicase n=1 Tax=Curvularia clavata TaxID=95742 RepID=A0A9Q9DX87_CURCL|nr:ATP-dependent DNA helicase MER3 [Curvularia clavata]